ncbi:MAG: peptide ABC transporter substrate-binding protein [Chloroflexi bacterium]|nr:peptide ABC transporter substrate-binding protein [Chloroflexota bacterium]
MPQYLRRHLLTAGVSLALVALVERVLGRPTRGQQVPAAGGTYVEGVVGHPTYLNPLLSPFNNADQDIVALVFSGLTRLAPDGSVVPDLASDWSISPDGRLYTFHLRPAVWQDGQPVTAEDAAFTIGQIQSPSFPGSREIARLWQSVTVRAVDRRTVQFTLAEPYAPFLEYTTLGLLPSHLLQGVTGRALLASAFNGQPVGTGPFQVKSASPREVVLEPNPRYYGKKPYLAGLTFRYYDSFDEALDALHRGDIQGLGNIPPDRVLALAADQRVTLLQSPEYARLNLVILNTESSLFANDVVRRALDLAIDRAKIIQVAVNGVGMPAAGPIMPVSWAFVAEQSAYTYDPTQAARLLDQAGWTNSEPGGIRQKEGKPFRFVLLAANEPERLRTAQEISRQLRGIGVEADVQTASWSTIVQDFLAPHRFDAVLTEIYSPTADPDPYPFWHSSQIQNGLNVSGWSNRIADQLLEDARQATDRQERRSDYAKFQSLFAQEQPAILLYYPVYVYALPSALNGASLGLMLEPANRFQTVTSWYLRTRSAGTPS